MPGWLSLGMECAGTSAPWFDATGRVRRNGGDVSPQSKIKNPFRF
jgi:hypothetical protein